VALAATEFAALEMYIVQIEALPEVENAPERKPTEEVHDQRWKARARSTSIAQAMADTSTRRTTRIAVASAPPPANRAAPTLRSEEEKQVGVIRRTDRGRGYTSASLRHCYSLAGWSGMRRTGLMGECLFLLDKEACCLFSLNFCKILLIILSPFFFLVTD
jgi:hypothetical protein